MTPTNSSKNRMASRWLAVPLTLTLSILGLSILGLFTLGLFTLGLFTLGSAVQAAEPVVSANEPPRNEFLADSVWPMSHRGPYNQASSPHRGPTGPGEAEPHFVDGNPVSITLAHSGIYENGRQVVWGVTTRDVFKLDSSGSAIKYIAKVDREEVDKEEAISGAYVVLDRDGNLFVPRGTRLEAYRDAEQGNPDSEIELTNTYQLPEDRRTQKNGREDPIVGISMTFDGRLILLTEGGLVVSLSRELDDAKYLQLDSNDPISNSLALDESGGVFVVTSSHVVKVQWDAKWKEHGQQPLRLAWSVPYQTSTEQFAGRLGVGSGTTPSLMGTGDQDKFIVIGDGQDLMHMVLIWRDEIPEDWQGLPGRDRRIAAEVPVRFGFPNAERSTTEQSLTVRGYEVVAVSNLYGPVPMLSSRLVKRFFGDRHLATIYRSNYKSVAPYGVEKFRWDPAARKLRSVWANPELSVPNGIPTMSEATGLLYCIGQRNCEWTLEGIDWNTGKSVFHRKMSRSYRYNSFYAATEIGPGGSILTGTYGGVLQFGNQAAGSTAATE